MTGNFAINELENAFTKIPSIASIERFRFVAIIFLSSKYFNQSEYLKI